MSTQSIDDFGDSVPPSAAEPVVAVGSLGEYTFYPLEFCSEDKIARLFSEVSQRGNPFLRGRPLHDLEQLGRAMCRKARKLGNGFVVVYQGEPVAFGCGWDMADGGVWEGCGLEMPASVEGHAACGKAAFEEFAKRKRDKSTFFYAFAGVKPPHSSALFAYLLAVSFCLAHKMGFEDTFLYTLMPSVMKLGDIVGQGTNAEDCMFWTFPFSDVPSSSETVRAELAKLGDGTMKLNLLKLAYMFNNPDYQKSGAGAFNLGAAQIFEPAMKIAENQLKWLHNRDKATQHYRAKL
eukprot:TRINITY_DN26286_c0_g1_i1.p1 TRINITY_DN26286_c0_g1~~TRINITY_DN26286_c0_g1_i1.p1  ORF type:complete len:292 (+),score=29.48 TRINITY_DN26286_c0_g1_i1:65-940(+)